jgi:hypothetical protein
MKRLLFSFLIPACLVFASGGCATDDLPPLTRGEILRPADAYDYPVVPGMAEWAALQTGQEMRDACQIPVEVLKQLSTQAVIQAIWEHPLTLDVLHRAQYQSDFESFFSSNNACRELSERRDAADCLLERLRRLVPDPEFRYQPHILELIISQPAFLSRLSKEQKKALIVSTFETDSLRHINSETGRTLARDVSWLLVGRTLASLSYRPFTEDAKRNDALQSFLDGDRSDSYVNPRVDEITRLIIEHAHNYLER